MFKHGLLERKVTHCMWRPNSVSPSLSSKKTNDKKVKEKFKDFAGSFRMDYKCLIILNLIWEKGICQKCMNKK